MINQCQKIVGEALRSNIDFIINILAKSSRVFAAVFQSVLELYPEEAVDSEQEDQSEYYSEISVASVSMEMEVTDSTNFSDEDSFESELSSQRSSA